MSSQNLGAESPGITSSGAGSWRSGQSNLCTASTHTSAHCSFLSTFPFSCLIFLSSVLVESLEYEWSVSFCSNTEFRFMQALKWKEQKIYSRFLFVRGTPSGRDGGVLEGFAGFTL